MNNGELQSYILSNASNFDKFVRIPQGLSKDFTSATNFDIEINPDSNEVLAFWSTKLITANSLKLLSSFRDLGRLVIVKFDSVGDWKRNANRIPKWIEIELEPLDLVGCGIVKLIADGMKNGTRLTHLKVKGAKLGSCGAYQIASALEKSSSLLSLKLSGDKLGMEGGMAIARVFDQSIITSLDLSSNGIGADAVKLLTKALRERDGALSLNIGRNRIGDYGAKGISSAIHEGKLFSLDISYNHITHVGTKAIAESLRSSKSILRTLKLNYNNIEYDGVVELAKVLKFSRLVELELSSNYFGDEATVDLAIGLVNSQITTLGIEQNEISSKGLKALAHALPFTRVKILKLSGNNINDEDCKYFASTLTTRKKKLYVNLNDNPTGTKCKESFKPLEGFIHVQF
jgi:Ran GTPase-activating protein (RanGAP) involved in mRNA processing and transport